ncbi:hypothetical protein CCH79_00008915, partial [Gambusia affinis]
MSSRKAVSVTGGASRNRENENEDPSEGNGSNEGHNQWTRPTTSWPSDADQAGQHLAKPALSGRKARRKTCPEDKQGRRGDRNQERDEERRLREVRTGRPSQYHLNQTQISESEDEEEEDENKEAIEEGCGVIEVTGRAAYSTETPPCIASGERRMSKREKNRIESLRRRQRRREKWRPSQQPESTQSSTETPTTTSSCSSTEDEETLSMRDKEGFICAVCLDVYFSPYMCHPCNHIFCEPCLRTLAKNNSTNTPCPLCRTVITHVFFQKELNQTAKTFFPKEYLSRKQNFQRAPCSKQSTPSVRRQFPHGGGFPLDTLDFEDDSRGWRFDMDMVIIYIYSVNW